MTHRHRYLALGLAASTVVVACGDGSDTPSAGSSVAVTTTGPADTTTTNSPSTSPTTTGSPSTTPPTPTKPTITAPQEGTVPATGSSVESAIADLAARLDTTADQIEVVSVEEVTWSDGSLGCPEPGMSYTQALVNGQRIVLSVDGTEYEYHSGRNGEPFYCPADRVTPPAAGGYGDT